MKRMIPLFLALLMSLLLVTPALATLDNPYPDVKDSAPYLDAVIKLYDYGIMKGDTSGNFNPDKTITREEFAAIVCRLLQEEEAALAIKTSTFSDVASGRWSAGYIARAAQLGIVSGYGGTRFGPTDPVTVEQAAKMLVCAWGYEDSALEAGGWPDGYLAEAEYHGILNGVKSASSAPAKRWEVALMAYQMRMNPTADEQGGFSE